MIKIAFLFLVISDVYHQASWKDFFNGHDNAYSIYVHSKTGVPQSSSFKKYEIARTVPTRWENTMRAQVELLREALKDPNNQKFVFVSETTIPLQPFGFAYKHLTAHPFSEFEYERNTHNYRTFHPIPQEYVYKSTQWVVLNRKHAELMANDTLFLDIITRYPFDNEHYPATLLVNHSLEHEIVKNDCTFVYWPPTRDDGHPHTFTNFLEDEYTGLLLEALITQRYLFARKIDKDCDLTKLRAYMSASQLP